MINKGYTIKPINKIDFDQVLLDIYPLITKLYSDFPEFKMISQSEFVAMFTQLKIILNYNIIKASYYDNKLVGFFISLPDYGNAVYGKLNIKKLAKILTVKAKAKKYILLYLAVDSNHKGLGAALTQSVKDYLQKHQVKSIGALIIKNKVSAGYFSELMGEKYEYVLLKREF